MEQNGIKNVKNGDLGAAKLVIPVAFFLNEGGEEFLVQKPSPFPLFNPFRAGVARPGELTCICFWEEISKTPKGQRSLTRNPSG